MKHEKSSFGFKLKNLDGAGDGSFEGVLAVYGNVDLGGDIIEPGAFVRTLNAKSRYPLLWQHQNDNPIGYLDVIDSQKGLMVTGQLDLDIPQAKIAYSLLKSKIISGLSIGYDTVKSEMQNGVRMLKELRLWEGSLVTFPMNEMATVTAVKTLSDDDRATHLRAIDEHRKAIDRHQQGIRSHLKELLDLGDADDPLECDEDDEATKAFVVEMRKLVEEAKELA